MKLFLITLALVFLFVTKAASRRSLENEFLLDDSHASETGHPHHHKAKGRLQMKVYRGPKDGHHFAPWGYWLKHPEDDKHHGKY